MSDRASILVVDDEPGLREMLTILFRRERYEVTACPGFATAREAIRNAPTPYGVVLTDLMMPDGSGLDVLSLAKERSVETEVIVMTAHSTVETAIEAMKRGAYDFVTKPFATAELRALVQKAFEKSALVAENVRLRAQVDRQHPKDLARPLASRCGKILELIARVAESRSTVLITGESGTGKERIARAVHDVSDRKGKPFLVVNCGAIPEALVESELFGHEKGAFTGATSRKLGIFREAEGGTVLLDEVGELPLGVQVKLLRVLQEQKVRGVGESNETTIDVRVLAATNRDVEEDVKSGKFRQDLYYRLNVIRIEVPPLRVRREDVGELAKHFLERCSREHNKQIRGFSPDALRALDAYDFPGNVRELENIVERAVALASGQQIGLGDLPHEVSGAAAQPSPALVDAPRGGLRARRGARRGRAAPHPPGARALRRRAHRRGEVARRHAPQPPLPDAEARAAGRRRGARQQPMESWKPERLSARVADIGDGRFSSVGARPGVTKIVRPRCRRIPDPTQFLSFSSGPGSDERSLAAGGRDGTSTARSSRADVARTLSPSRSSPLECRSASRAPSRAGFTLVELMIVVAIVGVLSVIAVVGYRKLVLSGKVTEAQERDRGRPHRAGVLQGRARHLRQHRRGALSAGDLRHRQSEDGVGPGLQRRHRRPGRCCPFTSMVPSSSATRPIAGAPARRLRRRVGQPVAFVTIPPRGDEPLVLRHGVGRPRRQRRPLSPSSSARPGRTRFSRTSEGE